MQIICVCEFVPENALHGSLIETNEGSIEQIDVIEGNSLLVEATTTAVKQWRYRPSVVKAKPIRFVVVVSFGKAEKVR
ncbi:MAG: energy transducer TonB [Candidatus Sulfotelmatobacter sp.]